MSLTLLHACVACLLVFKWTVPRSWGAYAHGLSSLRTDWGVSSHAHSKRASGNEEAHGTVHGAPGVGETVARRAIHGHDTTAPSGPRGVSPEFGSAVGRALAEETAWGRDSDQPITSAQNAAQAAQSLIEHPLRMLASQTRSPPQARNAHRHHASPWRRTHMAEAEARVEAKAKDEEAGMSRLRRVIARDRNDLQHARNELRGAASDLESADKEVSPPTHTRSTFASRSLLLARSLAGARALSPSLSTSNP